MSNVERTADQSARRRLSTRKGVAPSTHADAPRRRLITIPMSGRFRGPRGLSRHTSEDHGEAHERRVHGRFRFEQQLLFCTHKSVPASVARTRNLSQGGLCIESTRPIRSGEIIVGVLRVDPAADQRPIEFVGRVVWHWSSRHAREGFAVRFLHLSDEDRRRVEDLIAGHDRAT